MRIVKMALVAIVVVFAGCASQEAVEEPAQEPEAEVAQAPEPTEESEPESPAEETPEPEPDEPVAAADTAEQPEPEPEPEPTQTPPPDPLAKADVVYFMDGTGARIEDGSSVTMPAGGPPDGRLTVESSSDQVVLYLTKDATIPSERNYWVGPIDPSAPPLAQNAGPVITAQRQTTTQYRAVAAYEGRYSDVVTVTVTWELPAEPDLSPPRFVVDGDTLSGEVQLPVTRDGEQARIAIHCGYAAAVLYITIDGTDPTPENYEYRQRCLGTYVYSVEPGVTEYRVISEFNGVLSELNALTVEWTEE